MYPQQNQLPPELMQPMFQPMQFTMDRPPLVPQVPCGNPNLINYLPALASILLNEIGSRAGNNPMRVLHFNLTYTNNFSNSNFATTFALAVDLLDLAIAQNPQVNIEQLLAATAYKAATYASVALTQLPKYNAAFNQVLQPQLVHEMQNVLSQYANDDNSINRLKSSRGQFGGVPQLQPMQYGNASYPMNNGFQQPAVQPWQQQPNQYGNPASSGVFSSGGGQYPMGTPNTTVGSRYANPHSNSYPQSTPVTQNTQIPSNNTFYDKQPVARPYNDLEVKVKPYDNQTFNVDGNGGKTITTDNPMDEYDSVTRWVYSDEQPYPPAINPKKEKLVSKTYDKYVDNGSFKTVTETLVIPRSKAEMERDLHTITSVTQAFTAHIPHGSSTREEAVEKALTGVIATNLSVPEKGDELTEVTVGDQWNAKTFLADAIQTTRIMQCSLDPEECQTFRSYNIIMPTFVSRQPHDAIVKHITTSTTLAEVAYKMKNFLDNPKHDDCTRRFIYDLDRFICKELVLFLNGKLSVNLKKIDCFVDDYKDIAMYITNQASSAALEAFQKNEFKFLSSILKMITAEELRESLVMEEFPNVHMNAFENAYSITCVNVLAEELNIQLHNPNYGNSSLILQSSNPVLFNFAKNLFAEAKERDSNFAHHLLVTADQKCYEIHEAILGFEENYLISEFTV